MREDDGARDDGWREFLGENGLWDERLGEWRLYQRYLWLHKLEFPAAPKEMWPRLYQDLLRVEAGLVYGDAIGLVAEHPFRFTVEDGTPIRQKPRPLPARERQWVREYVGAQEALGILKKVPPGGEEPVFAVNAVLVKGGQSQQDYRLCANLVEPNNRVAPSAQPLVDCEAVRDELQGCKVKSALDIKAGFFNIPIPAEL